MYRYAAVDSCYLRLQYTFYERRTKNIQYHNLVEIDNKQLI